MQFHSACRYQISNPFVDASSFLVLRNWSFFMFSSIRIALVSLGLLCLMAVEVTAAELLVHNQKEYAKAIKNVQPGDTIVLANGTWRDFEIRFVASGREGAPITLTAQDKGQVIISGQSNLSLAGSHLVVSGLVFKDGYTPTSAVISFRKNKENLAYHSRVTEVVIDNFNNPERTESDSWVAIYGKHNRFDHNHLVGKRNKGVTMAVRLNTEESRENHHRIDHNYFGPRSILGSNGGETLRIGTSHYSLSDSFTVVENNYFDRCDGELEIISNKSGSNTFRGNVFFESRGTLTMRHGNGNRVENNVFFGNGVDHTGGIRVINKGQIIRNNYMEGLAGYRFGGALVVMNGVPDSPINRYHQVEDAVIENNTLVNSDHIQLAAGSDQERSAVPINSKFRNNLIYNENGADTFTVYDDVSGIKFENNLLHQVKKPTLSEGFESRKLKMVRAENGLMYAANSDVGVARDLNPIRKDSTGVSWYPKPEAAPLFGGGNRIQVEPGYDTLVEAVKSSASGDVLQLSEGEFSVSKFIQVAHPLSVIGSGANASKISFERSALFEIVAGGNLQLQNLGISGAEAPDSAGNAVIRTQRNSMLENYQLLLRGIEVKALDVNHSFDFVRVAKSTFADRIEIIDSSFSDVSGAILKLNAENDDYGIYNAEYVDITGSTFENVQGALIDFYRGGTDESTFGPHFLLENSEVTNLGHSKRNKSSASVFLHGVQVTNIRDNRFRESKPISLVHTVGEPRSHISENHFDQSPAPEVVELNSGLSNTAVIENNVFE